MILSTLDILGTLAFAISGAFRAIKHELDLLGLMVLAIATGVGGGIVRDVLLGSTPPVALRKESYLLVCVAGALLAILNKRRLAYHWDLVMLADAIGLGLFAAIGAQKAEALGSGPLTIILMAGVTATGGGVIRDLLVMEIPAVLKSDFYTSAALLGGCIFWSSGYLHWQLESRLTLTVVTTSLLRIFAMKRGMHLPRIKSLPESPSHLTRRRKRVR